MRAVCLVLAGAVVTACSSSSGSEPFTCAIGELTGTWRLHYTQQDGDCGKIPDETVVLSSSAAQQSASKCTYHANTVASDKCSAETDFTCPTTDNKGTQRWTGTLRQTSATSLTATMTAQLQHQTLGSCRSTYTIDYTKL